MTRSFRPGDVLAGRYRLVDLLVETGNGRFWRAYDDVLERHVALHVIAADDERSHSLLEAARRSTTVVDRHVLRVLDAAVEDDVCYVVNEWGSGVSLDIMVEGGGVLTPRQAAWVVAEVADTVALAHAHGVAHGRLAPENLLLDRHGQVRVIGLCVDAALHGQPVDRIATDVTDLAGLLYCALTATWAGASRSDVRRAPREHGHVLRPRQVRAGIPRPLDELCDLVLHPHTGTRGRLDEVSAATIAARLRDFVGDPGGIAEEIADALPPVRERFALSLPAVPELRPRPHHRAPEPAGEDDDRTRQEPVPDPDPSPDTTPTMVSRPAPADAPTQAAIPTFDEPTRAVPGLGDGEPAATDPDRPTPAGPASARPAPPPPPPLEEPPQRPLFAPEPPAGTPARRTRHGATTTRTGAPAAPPASPGGRDAGPAGRSSSADDRHGGRAGGFWPWDTGSRELPAVGAAASAGSTTTGIVAPADERVPGRNWMRLALVLALLLALLVAAVVVYNLGRGRTPLGAQPDPTAPPSATASDPSPTATPEPVEGLVATDLDPQGDDGAENPAEAPLAVDGDAATGWRTVQYFQQLGPAGLKTGVGLVVDLGQTTTVTGVDLTFAGAPTSATLYVADEQPGDVTGLSEVGGVDEAGDAEPVTVTLGDPTDARYLVVWLTSLPADGDGFRGEVREVAVRGE